MPAQHFSPALTDTWSYKWHLFIRHMSHVCTLPFSHDLLSMSSHTSNLSTTPSLLSGANFFPKSQTHWFFLSVTTKTIFVFQVFLWKRVQTASAMGAQHGELTFVCVSWRKVFPKWPIWNRPVHLSELQIPLFPCHLPGFYTFTDTYYG